VITRQYQTLGFHGYKYAINFRRAAIAKRLGSGPVKLIACRIEIRHSTKWIRWMKRGVEDWQKAFEAAGFKNAIIARVAPTPERPASSGYSTNNWIRFWTPPDQLGACWPDYVIRP
jgi:hypothetical protein